MSETHAGVPSRGLRRALARFDLVAFVKSLFVPRLDKTPRRTRIVALAFTLLFAVIVTRLATFGLKPPEADKVRVAGSDQVAAARPDILDRNGEVLATDIKVTSIFAEPRRLVDKDEATELLTAALPDVNAAELRRINSWFLFGPTNKSSDSVGEDTFICI